MSSLEEDKNVHLNVMAEVAATMGGPTAGALSWENVVWRASTLDDETNVWHLNNLVLYKLLS